MPTPTPQKDAKKKHFWIENWSLSVEGSGPKKINDQQKATTDPGTAAYFEFYSTFEALDGEVQTCGQLLAEEILTKRKLHA
jgi:hypothetical protein